MQKVKYRHFGHHVRKKRTPSAANQTTRCACGFVTTRADDAANHLSACPHNLAKAAQDKCTTCGNQLGADPIEHFNTDSHKQHRKNKRNTVLEEVASPLPESFLVDADQLFTHEEINKKHKQSKNFGLES